MVVYKKYGMKVYRRFLRTNFNSNFGVNKEQFLHKIIDLNKAKPSSPIVTYNVTYDILKNHYVPILNRHLGGYVMFLAIVTQEGGGAGNWINHYGNDTSANYDQQMLDDIKYIKGVINSYNYAVTRSAPEVLHGTPYVPDKSNSDTKTLKSCKKGSVGRYYMVSTMAGNAWVFATKWCEAHQGAVPNVYFGNPYDDIIDLIKSCGGKINGSGGSSSGSSSSGSTPAENAKYDAEAIVDEIKRALRFDVHNIAQTNYYENAFISLERTYNNTFKLRFRHDFLENLINNAVANSDDHDNDNGNSDDFNDSSISAGKWWFPVRGKGGISDPWGYRAWRKSARNPTGFHDGMDIGNAAQIPEHKIYACHSGTVVYSAYMMAELMWVIIIKTGKYYIWYQEFTSTANNVAVKVGDKVKAKQYLGYVTGTHVHVGITKQKDINQALASAFTNNGTWLNPKKFFWNKRW